jgi:hypothetical protein
VDGEGVVEPPHAASRAVSAATARVMANRRMAGTSDIGGIGGLGMTDPV